MRRGLAALFFAGIATSSLAADLPPAQPYPAPAAVVAPAFTWTGFYVGINGGYSFGQTTNLPGRDQDINGPVAGGQIGFNWQAGQFVFGVEGDFQATWQERSDTVFLLVGTFANKQKLPWFATARARAGIVFSRSLIYVTGGAGWIDFRQSGNLFPTGLPFSEDDILTAGVVGGGVETMITDHWTMKVESLYLDTGFTSVGAAGVRGRIQNLVTRLGVNYKF